LKTRPELRLAIDQNFALWADQKPIRTKLDPTAIVAEQVGKYA